MIQTLFNITVTTVLCLIIIYTLYTTALSPSPNFPNNKHIVINNIFYGVSCFDELFLFPSRRHLKYKCVIYFSAASWNK